MASLVCGEAVGKSSAVERCDLASLGGRDGSGLGEDRTAQTCRGFGGDHQDILHLSPLRAPLRFMALASCHLITYNAAPRKRFLIISLPPYRLQCKRPRVLCMAYILHIRISSHHLVGKQQEQVLSFFFFKFQLVDLGGHWHDSTAGGHWHDSTWEDIGTTPQRVRRIRAITSATAAV